MAMEVTLREGRRVGKITSLDSRHRRQASFHHMIEHVHDFLLVEQAFEHQVFRQQRKEFGAAMAFQVLEFGERAVDLAGRTEASGAVRVLCGHGQSSLLYGADRLKNGRVS